MRTDQGQERKRTWKNTNERAALESRLLEVEEARKEALAAHEKAQRTMRE
jgi:hypothetical protein